MSVEIWRKITNFPGYEVSSHGRVRCWYAKGRGKYFQTEKLTKYRVLPQSNAGEYPIVNITRRPCGYTFGRNESIGVPVHILVAIAFLSDLAGIDIGVLKKFIKEETGEIVEIHHKDENKRNAAVENLCWITRTKHRTLHTISSLEKILREQQNLKERRLNRLRNLGFDLERLLHT